MALEKTMNLVDSFGETRSFQNCYIKVTGISGDKSEIFATAQVFKSKDEETALSTSSHNFQPSLDGNNFIKQAYEHLKTLPQFEDATDV